MVKFVRALFSGLLFTGLMTAPAAGNAACAKYKIILLPIDEGGVMECYLVSSEGPSYCYYSCRI